jgi:glycosyltransferase involved in cell wall biosynthesis
LRSFHIARAIATGGECLLAAPAVNPEYLNELQESGLFRDIQLLPVRPGHGRWQRKLRTNNGHYLAMGWPRYLQECRDILRKLIDRHSANLVLGVNLSVAEFICAIPGVYRVLDDFDCHTLTLERELEINRSDLPIVSSIKKKLALLRYRRQESRLHSFFDLVTTIAPPDAERLRRLSPEALIKVVPNGVDEKLLNLRNTEAELTDSIAFWGNLEFKPNLSAVRFFVDHVYAPYLADKNVTLFLIGGGAGDWIKSLPEKFPRIKVTGFIEDLAPLVTRIPVMVNPMVSGSGLKNKLLEAFALERAVVSTTMGSDCIDAEPGKHFRQADSPEDIADQILELLNDPEESRKLGQRARRFVARKYTWEAIEVQWRDVLASVQMGPRRADGGRPMLKDN